MSENLKGDFFTHTVFEGVIMSCDPFQTPVLKRGLFDVRHDANSDYRV